jgi:prepilin-type N-terminal cleavage/methylation domain-containing protein
MKTKGFTLIEILVVIAIIASIVSIAVPNYLEARTRAQDARVKSDMAQIVSALRLYYTDYHSYPGGSSGTTLNGCKAAGTAACPCQASVVDFAAGGAGCDVVYMRQFPAGFGSTILYYQALSGEDFCMSVLLNNKSDPEVVNSQNRCRNACDFLYSSQETKYWMCAD